MIKNIHSENTYVHIESSQIHHSLTNGMRKLWFDLTSYESGTEPEKKFHFQTKNPFNTIYHTVLSPLGIERDGYMMFCEREWNGIKCPCEMERKKIE